MAVLCCTSKCQMSGVPLDLTTEMDRDGRLRGHDARIRDRGRGGDICGEVTGSDDHNDDDHDESEECEKSGCQCQGNDI